MRPYQIILLILGILLLIAVIVFVSITTKIYKDIFKGNPNPNIKDDTECSYEFAGISQPSIEPMVRRMVLEAAYKPHEDLYIKSYDGLKLHGSLYRFGDDNSPLVICFHGYKGNKFRDFLGAIKIYEELKYNVILVDQRAQKQSEGRSITFGVKESRDVISWINKGIEIYGKEVKISLEGLSMGGATVLFALTYHKLPKNVKCVATDCPFISPLRIFEHSLKHLKLPKFLIRFTACFIGIFYMGINFAKYDVLRDLNKDTLPILIIHGRQDIVVPIEETIFLKEKYKDVVTLEVFNNSNHALSYFEDTERYHKVTKDFLKNICKKRRANQPFVSLFNFH